MTVYRLAAIRQQYNPVRQPTFNASLRAGDDFKLALTVYEDDQGTISDVTSSNSRLALISEGWERWGPGWTPDYGWGWCEGGFRPQYSISGQIVDGPSGRLNFMIPSSSTIGYGGRYRMMLQVDLYDGTFTELEGAIQVRRAANALGHTEPVFFQVGVTPIGSGMIPAIVRTADNMPLDRDGFPLLQSAPVILSGTSPVLGLGVLNQMILAD